MAKVIKSGKRFVMNNKNAIHTNKIRLKNFICTEAALKIPKFKVMENSNGQMEDIILVILSILRCKDKVKCPGQTHKAKKLVTKDNF